MSNLVNMFKIVRFPLVGAIVVSIILLGPTTLGYILGFGWIALCLAYSFNVRKKNKRYVRRHQHWPRS